MDMSCGLWVVDTGIEMGMQHAASCSMRDTRVRFLLEIPCAAFCFLLSFGLLTALSLLTCFVFFYICSFIKPPSYRDIFLYIHIIYT